MMSPVIVCAALSMGAFVAPPSRVGGCACRAALPVAMCASDDLTAKLAAAQRVVDAAASFGDAQGSAAKAWVAEALAGKPDAARLLEQQMVLFDECIIDEDDGAKCKELDEALSKLEKELDTGNNELDRAAARVRKAAAKFGAEQEEAASVWLEHAKLTRAANPALLLQAQVALFGECLLDDEGSPARCNELQDAISALQASLGVGGKVVSTRAFMPEPAAAPSSDDSDEPPPEGFQWGLKL